MMLYNNQINNNIIQMLRNTLRTTLTIRNIQFKQQQKSEIAHSSQTLLYLDLGRKYSNKQQHQSILFTHYYNFSSSARDIIDYKKDYYQILKIKQTSNLNQIKKSFYTLAKQSHPDTSKGNQQIFKSINQAYNVLSHQQRRKQYDANRFIRVEQNPNNFKQQQQHQSNTTTTATGNQQNKYEQRHSQQAQNYQHSEEYSQRKDEAYYHYNRGQWQQYRSGYKYHVSPASEYQYNMTNNMSSQKIYQNIKRNQQNKKSKSEEEFLEQMEKYFEYMQKIKRKKLQDIEQYHRKMEKMEKQLYEKRKQAFRNSFIGKGITKIQNLYSKFLHKQVKQNQSK